MAIINRIADWQADMTRWRRDIHAHPETAFEETRTSEVVAGLLDTFGIEVHRGLAGTGVVGDAQVRQRSEAYRTQSRSRRPRPPREERVRPPLDPRREDACLRS